VRGGVDCGGGGIVLDDVELVVGSLGVVEVGTASDVEANVRHSWR
jgi:hypothetical protein